MADETRKIRMKEHYTPETGDRKGKTLFAARVYELDPVTAKEVVDAKVGGYSQAQPDVVVAAPVPAEPESGSETAAETAGNEKSGPTVAELREEAKAGGVEGYSSMKKDELLLVLGKSEKEGDSA